VTDRGGVLVQVSTEDNHAAVDLGVAGECKVAAEDQNVAAHRTVEKNIPGENAHAAGGAALNVGGAENAAGIMELFVRREENVPAHVE
jgi:hypothetical protein